MKRRLGGLTLQERVRLFIDEHSVVLTTPNTRFRAAQAVVDACFDMRKRLRYGSRRRRLFWELRFKLDLISKMAVAQGAKARYR